jgi:hypothetical protein
MPPNVRATRSRHFRFVLDRDALRSLDALLSTEEKRPTYTLKTNANYTLEIQNLESLLQFPNYKGNSIVSLICRVGGYREEGTEIEFASNRVVHTITYSIRGNEDYVDRMASKLDQWANEIGPWYGVFYRDSYPATVLITTLLDLSIGSLLLLVPLTVVAWFSNQSL